MVTFLLIPLYFLGMQASENIDILFVSISYVFYIIALLGNSKNNIK